VERTEASVVLARVAQFDARLGGEVYNVNAGFDFVNGGHKSQLSVISYQCR